VNRSKFLQVVRGCLIALGLCALGFVAWVGWTMWAYGEFSSVPNSRDPQLIGWWKAQTWMDQLFDAKRLVHFYELRADGTGYVWAKAEKGRLFRWGSSDGRIEMKRRSAGEGWEYFAYSYRMSGDRNTLTLKSNRDMNIEYYVFARTWTRADGPPEIARRSGR
jgi:hypothetical protein